MGKKLFLGAFFMGINNDHKQKNVMRFEPWDLKPLKHRIEKLAIARRKIRAYYFR